MWPAILLLSSSPGCHVVLHSKGLVLPTSSPAAQVSVCSNSGCVMDGTTVLMEQMNMAVTTPPILPSVSLLYFRPQPESQKMSKSNTLKIEYLLFYSRVLSFLMRGHRSGNVSGPQLQSHLVPKHLAVHCWSKRSSCSPATVQSKNSFHILYLLLYVHVK